MESLEKNSEDDGFSIIDDLVCTEMKIGFGNHQKTSKKAFKITLPPDMLSMYNGNNGADCFCPVTFCGKKIPKNRSFEDHIREHLNLVFRKLVTNCEINGGPQFEVCYQCPFTECKYSDIKDQRKCFAKVKYLKQHFVKVHAPKDFRCSKCQKAFALQSYLESHEAMCGMLFVCSCDTSYTTLEALQTHLRRRNHSVDLEKYKKILSLQKSRIQEMKNTELVSNKESNSSGDSINVSFQSNLESTDINGQSGDQRQFCMISNKNQSSKKFVDFETQTGSQSLNTKGNGSSGPKRKKSAETQTTRVRVRISTETQTTNVVKRRRSTRKKQSAEAQTQCFPQQKLSHDQGSEDYHSIIKEEAVTQDPILYSEDSNTINPILGMGFDSDSYQACLEDTNVGNQSEFNPFKEMEVHMQTQTEPDLLLLYGDNIFSDYEVANLNDDFLNFVNTETQTANPSIVHNNFMDSATEPLPDITRPISGPPLSSSSDFKTLNSSYLETMDNETQTQFYDFLKNLLE